MEDINLYNNDMTSYVESSASLEQLCAHLRDEGSFAVDTEFVRERTFFIRLGIIQVATSETEAILDPQSIETMESFFDVIGDPAVQKIVHAGEQDFAAIFERTGMPPRNVFDTQIAAALVGLGEKISYARLVEKVSGVRLSKLETLTDWIARPLTRAQIDYALDDVRYLLPARQYLDNQLVRLGRETWALEEYSYLEDAATYTPPEPREYFKRFKVNGLSAVQLGALREVTAWREEEARRRDLPRGWVIRDQSLFEIARRRPGTEKELCQIRSLKSRVVERNGEEILAAVRRGVQDPEQKAALTTIPEKVSPEGEPLVRLLEAWLYARSVEMEIASSMLASRTQIKALVNGALSAKMPDLSILKGWRRELVGQDLLDILEGRLRLTIDPASRKLFLQDT